MNPLPTPNAPFNEETPAPVDIISQLEHYFRCSAMNGEDNLPRWATFSTHED